MNTRILLVDDDRRVVDGVRRTFHKQFEIVTALGGAEAIDLIRAEDPFAVVVSDYRMPEMDGVEFLSHVKEISPDTVRVMFTGQADLEAIISAINECDVFRLLYKPCPPAILSATLQAGVEQYRLVNAERELLEQTLAGSTEVLIDVLGLVDPATELISRQIRDRVVMLARALRLPDIWELELAARLSQLGTVGLPSDLVAKHRNGEPLDSAGQMMISQHPLSAYNMLEKIPRLERIGRMILGQLEPPDNLPQHSTRPDDIDFVAIGAHLLHIAFNYERSLISGLTPQECVERLRQQPGPRFRERALEMLEERVGLKVRYVDKWVDFSELEVRMVLGADLLTTAGMLVLSAGQELTQAHIERLNRFEETVGVIQPIKVGVPVPS